MGEPPPVASSGLAHSPQGGERNLHIKGHARTTVGGARPSTHTARRRAASCPCAACGHPSYQEVLCRGGSFPCIPPGLSGLGVRAAGRFWTAFGRQLPGAFPRAGEGAEVIQAADGGACGPGLEVLAETPQGSKESGAGSEEATWPPSTGWRLVPGLVLMTNMPVGLPVRCLQWTRCRENPSTCFCIDAPVYLVKYSQSALELLTCNNTTL